MYLTKYLIIKKISSRQSLLVNTLSGAMDIIENHHLPALSTPDKLSDPDLIKNLRSRNYIYDSEQQEKDLFKTLYKRYADKAAPPIFVICPTHSCNLRCRYCFEGSLGSQSKAKLELADVDALFNAFKHIDPNAKQLQLFGGEPLLPATYPVVEKILRKTKKLGYSIAVITNGVNIKYYFELIKKYRDLFDSFQITLDGPERIHNKRRYFASGRGTFNLILNSIGLLVSEKIRVSVRVNVDAENIDYLPELADIFDKRGWLDSPYLHFALAPVNDHKGDQDHTFMLTEDAVAKKFFKLREAHTNMGRINHQLFRLLDHVITTLDPKVKRPTLPHFKYCESNSMECYAFGADGYIYACSETIGDQSQAIGTFAPEFKMWSDKLAAWNNRSIMTLEKCRDCNISTFCGGGCAYAALMLNGSQDNPVCQDAKKVIDSYLDTIKDELLKEVVLKEAV